MSFQRSVPRLIRFGCSPCRLQGVKGGDGRRHRRARSEEAKTPVAAEEPRAAAILEDFKSSRAQQYALKVRWLLLMLVLAVADDRGLLKLGQRV